MTGAAQDAAQGAEAETTFHTADATQQGAAIYARQCAACHGDSLEGGAGPALKGTAFSAMASSQHLTAASLREVISRTMPMAAPGSLPPDAYAAVTAFILKQSGGLALATAATTDTTATTDTAATTRTASQGVYTEAQREQGKALYSDNCLQCHGGELDGVEDAPPLAGKLFISKWGGLPVGALHAFIDRSMPPGNGGALGALSESAVVAYILSRNGFPAGSMPLPADPAGLNGVIVK